MSLSLSLSRRMARPVVAALAVAGLALGVTNGVAAADDPPSATSGDKTADNLRWNLSLTAVNGTAVNASQAGVNVVHPGDTVTFMSKIWKNSGVDRYMTSGVRQIKPAGFQYLSHTVSRTSTVTTPDSTTVKAVCTGDGCDSVPILGNKGYKNAVDFAVTYQIPTTQALGDYQFGFLFDVYTFGSTQGSSTAGAYVRVAAVPDVATTATLTAPATATIGQPVTLTANVAPSNATGTVQFKDGGTDIGSPVTVSGGVATLNHTFTTAGNHDISAAFTAGAGFTGSVTNTQTVAVSQVGTTTSLSAPATAFTDEAVDLTAAVAPADATGTVQFKDGNTDLGAPVALNGGSATLSHTFTTTGNHDITAVYSGDATHAGSTSSVSAVDVSVKVVDSTTTLTAPATATIGAAVDLTATVVPSDATGTVEFKDGTDVLGSAAVNGGTATLNHAFSIAGNRSITAVYSGDATHNPSTSAASSVEVGLVEASVALNAPATADTATAVDLTATVTPAGATGTVEFKDGTDVLGSAPVNDGTATLSHTFTAGTHSVTAVYSGDASHGPATSTVSTVDVSVPVVDTTTTLSVPATTKTGTAVNLTATVAPGEATGTVQFKDGATDIGAPVTVAGGTATLSHTFTTDGSHSITAVYSGDATHNPSTSPAAAVDVSTDPAVVDTTTTLTVPATAKTGTAVDLKATVSPSGATGTVEFKEGTEVIGTAPVVDGVATLNHTFTTDGTHSVTATFSGDTTHNPSTSTSGSVEVSTDPTDPGTGGGGSSFGSLENLFGS